MMMEGDGTGKRVHPWKTWWYGVKEDMNSFSLFQEDAQETGMLQETAE